MILYRIGSSKISCFRLSAHRIFPLLHVTELKNQQSKRQFGGGRKTNFDRLLMARIFGTIVVGVMAHEVFKGSEGDTNSPDYKTFKGKSVFRNILDDLEKEDRLRDIAEKGPEITAPHKKRDDLPTYTLEEVMQHTTMEKRIWVTYGQGVYDITEFIPQHPGGPEKISMAAGSSVEPFWMLYGVHKNSNVIALLEKFRIGNLSPKEAAEATANMEDPYARDPKRHAALKPSSKKPFNAEPPPSLLTESFITPVDLFYVRNHLPVPEISEKDYILEVHFQGKDHSFTLDDLKKKFEQVTVTATVMCAGNRRGEMTEIKPVKGLNWGHAAVGNATWTGPRLSDVLRHIGVNENDPSVQHIQFEGLDHDVANVPYGASIPFNKAIDPKGDVILAHEMNGETLSRDHGFPVRAVVPGTVGARNVKWLGRIIVSDTESDSHWQQNDYKGFNPSVDWDTVDFSKSPAIQELPVISAICSPDTGSVVKLNSENSLNMKGYAWSGGGRRIVRVDVTADSGKTWHSANITSQDSSKEPHHWGWSLWSIDLPVPQGVKEVELWAKAVDSAYNTQPESFANIWNLRGVLGNAYHRVNIKIAS
ncbi:Sulfite oxidase, mitochondrial [Frankliniella fusca]|uniref:sulfite oxidase n=1 Tax=Frankliniella fusca TaxID=407009 RepID=A0AAE1HE25_9NEOP|nr:Sulfite oxidase, mitochondrial [Frankliniella fusca]